MHFDISNIDYNHQDRKRGITLPISLSLELAEFIGIVIGDGSLKVLQHRKSYEIAIAGDSRLDYEYHTKRINNLIKGLFNIYLKLALVENLINQKV